MFKKLFITLICVYSQGITAEVMTLRDIENRMDSFNLPKNMEINLWADPSHTQNPGYFSFDSKGRLMIAEIYRVDQGVDDIRRYNKNLSIADVEIETLEDRFKMYHDFKDQLPEGQFSNTSDKIRFVSDTNNDGKADRSTLFADGFNDLLDGLGAGIIERNGKVYYTNIPHLWQLEDHNNDGISDKRTSLQSGFGTRVSFLGHDMHGLIWGPEGRLYWSIGDRGYSFTTKEGKKIHGPNLGAVFRSNADGSNIEIYYNGLRNPQELVFDEFGNLFTADNDGDHGDFERINHLIEGGDSGWHAGHQSIMSFTNRFNLRSSEYTGEQTIPVAWLVNDMSLPRNNNQPQFMLPSIGQLYTGPSGLTYNPSNYLGEKWRKSFFIAHYGGSASGSYVSTFKNTENGASFLAGTVTDFIRGINVTDVDFGPDGRFYLSEFNFGGWKPKNEGAIYALSNPNIDYNQKQTHKKYHQLLTSDFSQKTLSMLNELLSIDHQTIRQRAQFAMADRGADALRFFKANALNFSADTYSRIHSIWGVSQLIRNNKADLSVLKQLLPLLNDTNDQVRIQTARVLGSHKSVFAESALIKALNDKHNQVAMYAAYALGKIQSKFAVKPIINKLDKIKDKDLWLRHALTMALKGIDKKHWLSYKKHPSKAVRLGILLSLRLLNDNDIAYFLNDKDQALVDEAIIAIDDKSLTSVRTNVASLLSPNMRHNTQAEAYIHHRIINANFNEGQIENAVNLLKYAASPIVPDRLAAEALAAIEGWQNVNPIDTVTGLPTLANKKRANITSTIKKLIPDVLAIAKDKALIQAMRIAGQVNYILPITLLEKISTDINANIEIREQALELIQANFREKAAPIATKMLSESSSKIRSIALRNLFINDKNRALAIANGYLTSTSIINQKIALSLLGNNTNDNIDNALVTKLKHLNQQTHEPAITLELLAAAEKSNNKEIQQLLKKYNDKLAKSDVTTQFASTLIGGDKEKGKALVFGGGAAQCIRCHTINGDGSFVGPDLSSIGKQHNVQYLLEALVEPNKAIAPGFGVMTLTMKSGETVSALFFGETEKSITLGKDQDSKKEYLKSEIETIQRPVSGMPPMRYILTKTQIRDILSYLKTLKSDPRPTGH